MTTFQRAARHTLMAAALLCMGSPVLAQSSAGDRAVAPKAAASAPLKSVMDAELLYDVLAGEMAFRSQDAVTAVSHMLLAARRTGEEDLYQRAADMAIVARSGQLALQVVSAWRAERPQSIPARDYELRTLLALGRVADTANPLVRYVRALPEAERLSFLQGLPAVYRRTPDKAVALDTLTRAMTQVARNHPRLAAHALTSVGRLNLYQGHPGQALHWAERAQRAEPKSDEPVQLALQVLAEADQLGDDGRQRAETLVQKYLAQSRVSTQVLAQYARLLVNDKQPEKARTQLDRAIAQNPQEPAPWLLRGALLADEEQHQAAQSDLEQFLKLLDNSADPHDEGREQALGMLARIAASRGDWAESELSLIHI